MREIGINMPDGTPLEFIPAAKSFGFDTIFTGVTSERDLVRIANTLAANGMRYETIHAPFDHINDIWLEGERGDAMFAELMTAVTRCAQGNVPIAVVHLSSGKNPPPVSEIGRVRY